MINGLNSQFDKKWFPVNIINIFITLRPLKFNRDPFFLSCITPYKYSISTFHINMYKTRIKKTKDLLLYSYYTMSAGTTISSHHKIPTSFGLKPKWKTKMRYLACFASFQYFDTSGWQTGLRFLFFLYLLAERDWLRIATRDIQSSSPFLHYLVREARTRLEFPMGYKFGGKFLRLSKTIFPLGFSNLLPNCQILTSSENNIFTGFFLFTCTYT